MADDKTPHVAGYGMGSVDTVLSVEDAGREAEALGAGVARATLMALADGQPALELCGLCAGYGGMEILHGIDLALGRGQSLCLIGPNGAGKSTVLHAIFGLADVTAGAVLAGGENVTGLSAREKLRRARLSYVLQDNSVFADMTVEENLLLGGYLLPSAQAQEAVEGVFARYDRLALRRREKAGVLSGGERRLLEISRALVLDPDILLIDEPSIGLEPRFIDMVFEILAELQRTDGKTILMVEQNAKKGLAFADLGYVLVSGRVALAGAGDDLLVDPRVGRLFLGG